MADEKKPAAKKPRKTAAQKRAEEEAKVVAQPTSPDEPTTELAETDSSQNEDQSNSEGDEQLETGESDQQAEGLSEYKPKQRPLQAAGLDQHAAAKAQEKERQAERDEHNKRTGDVSRQGWNH